jgi:hypothetical protein
MSERQRSSGAAVFPHQNAFSGRLKPKAAAVFGLRLQPRAKPGFKPGFSLS